MGAVPVIAPCELKVSHEGSAPGAAENAIVPVPPAAPSETE